MNREGGSRDGWSLRGFQFPSLKYNHVFIDRLQNRISETCVAVQKASLADVQNEKLQHRSCRHSVEELFLLEAAFMKVFCDECPQRAESMIRQAVFPDLFRLKCAVRI